MNGVYRLGVASNYWNGSAVFRVDEMLRWVDRTNILVDKSGSNKYSGWEVGSKSESEGNAKVADLYEEVDHLSYPLSVICCAEDRDVFARLDFGTNFLWYAFGIDEARSGGGIDC